MAPVIELDDDEIEELAAIARNCDKLSEIVTKVAEIGPKVGTAPIAQRLAKIIGLDFDEVILVINGLVRVYGTRLQISAEESGASSEAAVVALTSSLQEANKPEVLSAWKNAKAKIVQALNALNYKHSLVLSHEAGFAASARPNLITSLRLFTDTRPVFNEEGNEILLTVIGHTLSLQYSKGYGQQEEIHFSLDTADVAYLFDLCIKADAQVSALKANISGPVGIPYEMEEEPQSK